MLITWWIDHVGEAYPGSTHENSTQVYTMSTHDDYHFGRKIEVGDHLIFIEGSLKKGKCRSADRQIGCGGPKIKYSTCVLSTMHDDA